MSTPRLPEELLDSIVDFLRNAPDDLKSCCLVSKSWIPRARSHLFAEVTFSAEGLQSWKNSFPDPSTSPACHTKTLLIGFPLVVTAADAEEGGWIPTFSRVVSFEIADPGGHIHEWLTSLALFHGFSPVVKSLRVTCNIFQPSPMFDLVLSFPLLEDLAFAIHDSDPLSGKFDEQPAAIQPSIPPKFTGSLKIALACGLGPFARRLLSLPSGIHFRRLDLEWSNEQDISWATALMEGCCSTLESLRIAGVAESSFLNLSKMEKLKDVEFKSQRDPQLITMTLRTIPYGHRNLRRISIDISMLGVLMVGFLDPANFLRVIGETNSSMWLELDQLLGRLYESHSIRLEVLSQFMEAEKVSSYMEPLLPKTMARGTVNLAKRHGR